MQSVKTLRKELGLSQKDFASLIGCNTGQLAMAEANMRRLPANSHSALTILQTKAEKSPAAKAKKAAPIQNKAISTMLEKAVKSTKIKLGRQQLKGEALENKITAAENMIAFADLALQQKEQPELTQMQLTVLQRQAGEKLIRYQLEHINCQLQIASLEAIIARARALKNI
jgi:transcriptional regulator with XRE-family HTH domain